MPTLSCPLCSGSSVLDFHRDRIRDYLRCQTCWLVFVPHQQHLTPAQEKAIYDLHQNQLDDPGYRRFLSRLAEPLLERLAHPGHGLDYGCGPGPLLATMLEKQGHRVDLYDPLYAKQSHYLDHRYDFITCSEVIEHFRQPKPEFECLFSLLKPHGILAVMSKRVIDAQAFATWHYKNDPTHIAFFSTPTLEWLAERFSRQLMMFGNDVALFLAPERPL